MNEAEKRIRNAIADKENQLMRSEDELVKLRSQLAAMENYKYDCPYCQGSGLERYTDEAGSGDWRECKYCKGLGKCEQLPPIYVVELPVGGYVELEVIAESEREAIDKALHIQWDVRDVKGFGAYRTFCGAASARKKEKKE